MANIYNSKYTRKQIEENIDQIKEDMKTLSGGDSGMSAKLSELETKVNNAGTSIGNLQKSVNDLNTEIGKTNTNVSNLTSTSATKTDLNNLTKRVDKLESNFTGIQTQLNDLKGKVDVMYGKKGHLIELKAQSNGNYYLEPDYRYNYINGHVNYAVVYFTHTELLQMEVGQEIYVFITGSEPFYIQIMDAQYIIGQDGERLSGSSLVEIKPENNLVEMSIVKVSDSDVFVRLQ